MLSIYFLQQLFNMSDLQAEDSLYDSAAMRNFVGIDLGDEAAPDETTICKFRHLIEAKGLSKMMLTAVNDHLKSKGWAYYVFIGGGARFMCSWATTHDEVAELAICD
jgi:IS5 family transposase